MCHPIPFTLKMCQGRVGESGEDTEREYTEGEYREREVFHSSRPVCEKSLFQSRENTTAGFFLDFFSIYFFNLFKDKNSLKVSSAGLVQF